MKKIFKSIMVVGTGVTLISCGSGASSSPKYYEIPSTNGGEPVTIQLQPLTKDEQDKADDINKAYMSYKVDEVSGNVDNSDNASNTSNAVNAQSSSFTSMGTFVPAKNVPDLNNFYGNSKYPVLNQQSFGTCVTFSISAALGYVALDDTNSISRLKILTQGFVDNNNKIDNEEVPIKTSGWDGAVIPYVMARIFGSDSKYFSNDVRSFFNKYGGLQAKGYYPEVPQDTALYDSLASQNRQSGQNLSDTLLMSFNGFQNYLNYFNQFIQANPASKFNNVGFEVLPIKNNGLSVSDLLKQTLDSGKKVLVGYTIYDSTVKPGPNCAENSHNASGDSFYSYKNGVLTPDTTTKLKDTWSKSYGCAIGGHAVFVVGYFINTNGNMMFVIRNSWADSTGDRGNYYMTSDYANNAIHSAIAVWKNQS